MTIAFDTTPKALETLGVVEHPIIDVDQPGGGHSPSRLVCGRKQGARIVAVSTGVARELAAREVWR